VKARSETSATLPAAGRPLAGSLSDPLMALRGWVGTLAPRDRPHRGRPPAEDANARNPAAVVEFMFVQSTTNISHT
jgi:hypothetical protein